jgi:hypothetical protein
VSMVSWRKKKMLSIFAGSRYLEVFGTVKKEISN